MTHLLETLLDTKEEARLLNPKKIDFSYIQKVLKTYKQEGGLKAAFFANSGGWDGRWSPLCVTYISDNGGYPDLAAQEIKSNLHDINKILSAITRYNVPQTTYHDIPPQDWLAGAFDLAQLSRARLAGAGNIFFVNCAPRRQQRGVETDNQGEEIYIGVLENGTIIAGTGPDSFVFFRDLVENNRLELYPVNIQTNGTQFRSREFFPWFTQLLAFNLSDDGTMVNGTDQKLLGNQWKENLSVAQRRQLLAHLNFIDTAKTLKLDQIPDLSAQPQIVRTDAHGNIKLNISESDIKPEWRDRPLAVKIDGYIRVRNTSIKDHFFDSNTYESAIVPGSSGDWKDSGKEKPRFLELIEIGGNIFNSTALQREELKNTLPVEIIPDLR